MTGLVYSVQELQFDDVWATIVPDVHIDTARKFAAADDMLAALEDLLKDYEPTLHWCALEDRGNDAMSVKEELLIARAKAAIAKGASGG